MSAFETFLKQLAGQLPEHQRLIFKIADKHDNDPFPMMQDLVDKGLSNQAQLCQLWSNAIGFAYVNPFNVELPTEEPEQLPKEIARMAKAIVLNSIADAATVAMVTPSDSRLCASLGKVLQREVSPVFAHPDEIEAILDLHFADEKSLESSLKRACDNLPNLEGGREIKNAQDAAELVHGEAFHELFNSILLTAFKRRTSDIHFESAVDECRVRMRIDGDMCTVLKLPRLVHEALVVRIKVLSQLDLAQRRMPQDGAFEIAFAGKRPAFRASTIPGIYGEKAVLRLLGSLSDDNIPRMGKMGFADSIRHALRRSILRPNGILFVCGPTGSGKTTTLYSCLGELNRPDLNIVTIEDPVEFRLPGINQHQVNKTIDLHFSTILRSILRQDPDVMLVGEIRDVETATIAAEAALTGHLVLSSLHTNNSLQAVTRLVELGVERYLVAPTVVGVLSQRLVRRICPTCKESYEASEDELAPYFTNPESRKTILYRGRGCSRCYGTGYLGRLGVHEMLEVSEDMRDLILNGASQAEMAAEAKRSGYRCMRHDGLKKALIGWTTLEEVERNTLPEIAYHAESPGEERLAA